MFLAILRHGQQLTRSSTLSKLHSFLLIHADVEFHTRAGS